MPKWALTVTERWDTEEPEPKDTCKVEISTKIHADVRKIELKLVDADLILNQTWSPGDREMNVKLSEQIGEKVDISRGTDLSDVEL